MNKIKIRSKYVGPRGMRGSKIVVKSAHGQRSYPYDHALRDNHEAAVRRYSIDVLGLRGNPVEVAAGPRSSDAVRAFEMVSKV